MTITIDRKGTLEMKLSRAKAASKYARTKAERERATEIVKWCEAELCALAEAR